MPETPIMMSTSSWISRVLCDPFSAHLDDNHIFAQKDDSFPPLAAVALQPSEHFPTAEHTPPDALEFCQSVAARATPKPSAVAVGPTSPCCATIKSAIRHTSTSAATKSPGTTTSPVALVHDNTAAALLLVPPTSASAALPALHVLVDGVVGTWAALSPAGGLSPETDTSTTSSSERHKVAPRFVLPSVRPAVALASAASPVLLSDTNVDLKWQTSSNSPSQLSPSPTTVRHERVEDHTEKENQLSLQRAPTSQKGPLQKSTIVASTPALTVSTLAAQLAPPTAPASKTESVPGGQIPETETRGKSVALTSVPPSTTTRSAVLLLTRSPKTPTVAAVTPTRANEGGSPVTASPEGSECTARALQSTVKKASFAQMTRSKCSSSSPSFQLSRVCAVTSHHCPSKVIDDQVVGGRYSECGAKKSSRRKSDTREGDELGSTRNVDRRVQNTDLLTGHINYSDNKNLTYRQPSFSPAPLEEHSGLCAPNANATAAATGAFEATYLDAVCTPLQPVSPSATSATQTLPFSIGSLSSTACSASLNQAARTLQPLCEATVVKSFESDRLLGNNATSKHDSKYNDSAAQVNVGSSTITCSKIGSKKYNDAFDISSNYTNTRNVSDNTSGNTSFLPSLLPLLSQISALSLSAGDFRDSSTLTAATAAAAIQPPSRPSSSSSDESRVVVSEDPVFNTSTSTGLQQHSSTEGSLLKGRTPYFPFFSFNSISSAFQSPAVSHLSQNNFCVTNTSPLPPGDAVSAAQEQRLATSVTILSTAAAGVSLDPHSGAALNPQELAAKTFTPAAGGEGTRTGPTTTCIKAVASEGVIQASATSVMKAHQIEGAETLSAGRTATPVPHRKVLPGRCNKLLLHPSTEAFKTPTAAAGAEAGPGGATATTSPLQFTSVAASAFPPAHRSGLRQFAEQQQLTTLSKSSTKCTTDDDLLGRSSSSNTGSICNTSYSAIATSRGSLGARKTDVSSSFTSERSFALQYDPYSRCTSGNLLQQALIPTTLSGDCVFAVNQVYCTQTPSRTRFSSVSLSPSLSQVYTASDNGTLCVWNMSGCCQRPLVIGSYHLKAITELDISPDGQLLASASLDGTIRLKHTATATHVVHPSGTLTADGGLFPKLSSLTSSRALPPAPPYLASLSAAPPHHALSYHINAAASQQLYQLSDGFSCVTKVPNAQLGGPGHGKKRFCTDSFASVPPAPSICYPQLCCLDFTHTRNIPSSNRSPLPVSDSRPGQFPLLPPAYVRRPASGEQQQYTVRGHSNAVVSLHFSSEGSMLLSASRDKTVKLWRNPSLDFLAAFTGHTNWVCCARFAPINAGAPVTFASCAEDRTVRVWNAERKTPVLFFRLCESFQSSSVVTPWSSLGSNSCAAGNSNRSNGVFAATGATSSSSRFGPCLKSCRFVFGGASVLAGGSSDGTVTLWDVRQEPKAPSQYYNASWLQSAPLYSTVSRPGSAGNPSSSSGNKQVSPSVTCEIERKGAVKKAGISYLDATADGTSLLALSTSGVAHVIDLRYNKPLFSVGHTKTSAVPANTTTPLVARGKKTCLAYSNRQRRVTSTTPQLLGAFHGGLPSQCAGGHAAATPAETAASLSPCAESETTVVSRHQQQQQRLKRTAAVITAASFGPLLSKYDTFSQVQQQVLATADAEGRVVVWRWDLATPQPFYLQEAPAAATGFCVHEQGTDPFSSVCSPYSTDDLDLCFPRKAGNGSTQACAAAEEETRATEADSVGELSCRQTAESLTCLHLERGGK